MTITGREPSLSSDNPVNGNEPYLGGEKYQYTCDIFISMDGEISILGKDGRSIPVAWLPGIFPHSSEEIKRRFVEYITSDDFKPLFQKAIKRVNDTPIGGSA